MMRDDPEGITMATDTERNLDTGPRTSAAYHGNEGPETGNQTLLERPPYALEQYRWDEEQQTRDEASRRIQECIVWLTSSRRGLEQLEDVLTTNAMGARASSAMHPWWIRHDVESPRQACAYVQGINQAAHPGEIYGELTTQVFEDLLQAGDASDLIMQDLTTEQSTQEEANRRFDEDLVSRIRDRFLNQQYWSDGEAWLLNSLMRAPSHGSTRGSHKRGSGTLETCPGGWTNLRSPTAMPTCKKTTSSTHASNIF